MKILVANLGSTSFKYRLFDMADERVLARGGVERIGSANSRSYAQTDKGTQEKEVPVPKFNVALEEALKREHFKGEAGKDYDPQRVQLFFMFYYIMTGLHVLHMIAGIGIILWLWLMARAGKWPKGAIRLPTSPPRSPTPTSRSATSSA